MSVDGDAVEPDSCQPTDSNVETLMENLLIDEKEPQAEEEAFCLLDKLVNVPDLAFIVISMLEYEDVVNLASVCKKWYRTVVNAPKSAKAVLTVHKFYLDNRNAKFTQVTANGFDKDWFIPMDNVFNMIGRIKTRYLDAYCFYDEETSEESEEYFNKLNEFFKFLLNHRNGLCFDVVHIFFDYPSFSMIDSFFLSRLFTQYAEFTTYNQDNCELPPLWRQEFQQLILESLSIESLECVFSLDVEFIHDLLMQIVNGQRPNFIFFAFQYAEEDKEQFISQVLRDIDPSQWREIESIDESTYEIDVPSSENIICTVDSNGFARLEKIQNYD